VLSLVAACARFGKSEALTNPQRVVDELLAADRGFSASKNADALAGVSAMLADDVWMPTARGDFARTRADAVSALRAALGPSATRLEWAPIRGGVSADGRHGFTFGYLTVHRRDTAGGAAKYLSYWVRQPAGWRVVALKLGGRPPDEVPSSMMAPSLPVRLVPPTSDPATLAGHTESLVAAERAFSDRAQRIGLGAAFVEYGRADAVNLGGRDDAGFVVGNVAIGEVVGGGGPRGASPVSWSAERAIVASSGDLGVTFGFIRQNQPPTEAVRARGIPFFTIWRRAGPGEPWRYVAE
jgi:hypothetical protein